MYLTDFLYDGVKLSSLGYLVGSAVTSNNESASAGSRLELQTVVNHGNHLTGIVNATYNEPITVTFDIIKYQCSDAVSPEMEDNEIASLVRWLNRKEWCKFKPLYNDLSFSNVYFMGTFNEISTIIKGGVVVGLTLTLTTNAPWGFMEYDDNTFTISQANGSFIIYDLSDELGNKYPEKIIITTTAGGDLSFTNNLNERTTTIKNCVSDETITLDCINKIITSNQNHTYLYNDFNYVYPMLTNTMDDSKNIFTSTLPCTVTIEYKPIRKVGILV